jgi:hypothetical protein
VPYCSPPPLFVFSKTFDKDTGIQDLSHGVYSGFAFNHAVPHSEHKVLSLLSRTSSEVLPSTSFANKNKDGDDEDEDEGRRRSSSNPTRTTFDAMAKAASMAQDMVLPPPLPNGVKGEAAAVGKRS